MVHNSGKMKYLDSFVLLEAVNRVFTFPLAAHVTFFLLVLPGAVALLQAMKHTQGA